MSKKTNKILLFLLRNGGRLNIGMIGKKTIRVCVDIQDYHKKVGPTPLKSSVLVNSNLFINYHNLKNHEQYIRRYSSIIGMGNSLFSALKDFTRLCKIRDIYHPPSREKKIDSGYTKYGDCLEDLKKGALIMDAAELFLNATGQYLNDSYTLPAYHAEPQEGWAEVYITPGTEEF